VALSLRSRGRSAPAVPGRTDVTSGVVRRATHCAGGVALDSGDGPRPHTRGWLNMAAHRRRITLRETCQRCAPHREGTQILLGETRESGRPVGARRPKAPQAISCTITTRDFARDLSAIVGAAIILLGLDPAGVREGCVRLGGVPQHRDSDSWTRLTRHAISVLLRVTGCRRARPGVARRG
jgi:hypothetical protein